MILDMGNTGLLDVKKGGWFILPAGKGFAKQERDKGVVTNARDIEILSRYVKK
jgi:hypothetical protein